LLGLEWRSPRRARNSPTRANRGCSQPLEPERTIELYGLVGDVRDALERLADALEDLDSENPGA
jgi:hypothetical protein